MNLKHLLLAAIIFVNGLSLWAAESFTWDNLSVEFLPAKMPGRIKHSESNIEQVNSVLGDNSVSFFQVKKEITFAPHQSIIFIYENGRIFSHTPLKGGDYCALSIKPGIKSDVDIFVHEAQDYAIESVVHGPKVLISFKSTTYSGLDCYFGCTARIKDLIAILEGEYFGLVIPPPKRVIRKNSQNTLGQMANDHDFSISFQDLSEMEGSDKAKGSQKSLSKPRNTFNFFKKK